MESSQSAWHHPALPYDIQSPDPVAVVHFWAEWNLYDRTMAKCLLSLHDLFDESFPLRSCNVDRNVDWVAAQGNVLNLPALSLVVAGTPRETVIGLRTESEWRECLLDWRSGVVS